MKMHSLVSVNIELKHYWPSNQELLGKAAVLKELCDRQTGKFLRTGTGMGSMDFAFEVEHAEFSQAKIGLILAKHLPDHEYTMHVKPIAASQDFAVAVQGRRSVRDRRNEPKRAKDGIHQGPGMGI